MEISKDRLVKTGGEKRVGIEIDPSRLEKAENSDGSGFSRGLGLGARGLAEGIAGFPLMLGDALNAAVSLVPGVKIGPASKAFSNLLTDIGVPEPETPFERMAVGVSRGGAGAMTMVGGAGAVSSALPRTAAVAEGLRQYPITQVASGVTSEIGSGGMREAGYGRTGQLVGGVMGGLIPGGVTAINKRLPSTDRGIAKEWSRITSKDPEITDIVHANREAAGVVEEAIPGLRFNEAARSGDPIKIGRLRAMQGGEAQAAARLNELQNTEALTNHIMKNIRGSGRPQDFLKRVEEVKSAVELNKAMALRKAESAMTDVELSARPTDVVGGDIRSAAIAQKRVYSDQSKKMLDDIDMAAKLNGTPIRKQIDDVFGSYDAFFSRVSSIPGKAMTRAKRGLVEYVEDEAGDLLEIPKDPTVAQVKEFNEQIRRDARFARSAGDFGLAEKLGRLKDGINATAKTHPEGQKLIKFWDFYSEEFIPKFRHGPTGEILRRKPTGEYNVSDTMVGAKFFVPGAKGKEGAKAFKTTFGDTPEATQYIREYAADDLLRFLKKTGKDVVDDSRFKTWKQSRSDALAAYGLDGEFATLEGSLQKLGTAITQEDMLNKQVFSHVAGVDADVAVSALMTGANKHKKMAQTLVLIRTSPEAKAGLKAALGDWFEARAHNFRQTIKDGQSVLSGAKLENFMRENKAVLKMVYNKQEMEALEPVLTALKRMSLETSAAKPVGSPTFELFSFLGNYAPLNTKLRLLRASFNLFSDPYKKALEAMVLEAMYNPEKASRLGWLAHEINQQKTMQGIGAAAQRYLIRQALLQSGLDVYRSKDSGFPSQVSQETPKRWFPETPVQALPVAKPTPMPRAPNNDPLGLLE